MFTFPCFESVARAEAPSAFLRSSLNIQITNNRVKFTTCTINSDRYIVIHAKHSNKAATLLKFLYFNKIKTISRMFDGNPPPFFRREPESVCRDRKVPRGGMIGHIQNKLAPPPPARAPPAKPARVPLQHTDSHVSGVASNNSLPCDTSPTSPTPPGFKIPRDESESNLSRSLGCFRDIMLLNIRVPSINVFILSRET